MRFLPILFTTILVSLLFSSLEVSAYTSEEHKLLTDKGVGLLTPPPGLNFPASVKFNRVSKSSYINAIKAAKRLAVGYGTNRESDYDKWKVKVQDNYFFFPHYGQSERYNKKIWIPDERLAPTKVLSVPASCMGSQPKGFSLGSLVAIYGDYRRTTYFKDGQCFLSDINVPLLHFNKGVGTARRKFAPDPMPLHQYLRKIGSGLVPPYGSAGNYFSDTVNPTDYGEAGWWGDEMMRLCMLNDWHFSNAAVAWYVGMHRLALLAVEKAIDDPSYWIKALHYEANGLHSYTDLFCLGHIVTNRDRTSWDIADKCGLKDKTSYKWMQNVIRVGGGKRSKTGHVNLYIDLPPIADRRNTRNDRLNLSAGSAGASLSVKANAEKDYHDEYNESGAWVYNLRGQKFEIYGDKFLRKTPDASIDVIARGVKASVKSLFDAYIKLKNREATVEQIGAPGSTYFLALKYLPVFIERDRKGYFTRQYPRYARFIDRVSSANVVPSDWKEARIGFLDGRQKPAPRALVAEFPVSKTRYATPKRRKKKKRRNIIMREAAGEKSTEGNTKSSSSSKKKKRKKKRNFIMRESGTAQAGETGGERSRMGKPGVPSSKKQPSRTKYLRKKPPRVLKKPVGDDE